MYYSKANFIYDTASISSLEWGYDPILPLFTLALMDNIFLDARITAESVYNRSEASLPRSKSVDLVIRREAADLSIFRRIAFADGVWIRDGNAMKYMDTLRLFKRACFLAGFLGEDLTHPMESLLAGLTENSDR